MSKERNDAMDAASWTLCGNLSKQTHTQEKEEGVQGQSPHINKVMG